MRASYSASMSVFEPYQRTIAPSASRTGFARVRNIRNFPAASRRRNSISNGSPVAIDAGQRWSTLGKSSGWCAARQPQPGGLFVRLSRVLVPAAVVPIDPPVGPRGPHHQRGRRRRSNVTIPFRVARTRGRYRRVPGRACARRARRARCRSTTRPTRRDRTSASHVRASTGTCRWIRPHCGNDIRPRRSRCGRSPARTPRRPLRSRPGASRDAMPRRTTRYRTAAGSARTRCGSPT